MFTKVIFKRKLANWLLVTVIAQFTDAITMTSKKATYFLPLMSGSINKLKSLMLFI